MRAELINLSCLNIDTNFSTPIVIDLEKKLAKADNLEWVELAFINKEYISFDYKTPRSDFIRVPIVINRSNLDMIMTSITVRSFNYSSREKKLMGPTNFYYKCSRGF